MHDDLQCLYKRLKDICASISDFQPAPAKPPILDSSLELDDENHWLHHENIPGLKKLREAVSMDLETLEK
ncbi:hypothetical protein HGRIS_012389 [Hohenbuehelia grisea]|uniref:Uncharacterized protein n=1 Tax=Hohenbuehelia grisea TaxID=104357 RepID=A0ABR3IS77_9AGAR